MEVNSLHVQTMPSNQPLQSLVPEEIHPMVLSNQLKLITKKRAKTDLHYSSQEGNGHEHSITVFFKGFKSPILELFKANGEFVIVD